jgi:MtaA/CmuA family methyltransferase
VTGSQRIIAALTGGSPDRLPLMPITMMFAADTAGIRYREYATDHRALAEAQVRTAKTYGFDYVSVISDPAREAHDLGAAVEWFADQPPAIIESRALLHDKSALRTLRLPDPLAAGSRMRDRVDGVRLLAGRAGSELIVEGWVEGPCAMGADLRGVNTLMLDFTDDPDFVRELFEFVVTMETTFAKAQVEAGATLIGIGDAAASLIGPKRYQEFVFPYEARLIADVRALGVPVRLHICGNTKKILGGMGQTGAEMIDIDFLAPLSAARAEVGPDTVLAGNIDPVRVLRDGTPESVTAAIAECHREAGDRYIVAAGCEVPRGTPAANIHALAEYARTHK